ncbi:MAG: flagellar protein FlgA [Chloroflexus sp.]|uniref:NAD(P)H-dependent oxidoreductase n=1 Tax=Chloroflexus sp. TaxID=1904827 RepID=UPI0021DD1D9A|nr:SAF domain-containing protein [Chloroflexus sp.]GIV89340.1 MAG: flagellar protein FlgA [Chloroflexus sp.]
MNDLLSLLARRVAEGRPLRVGLIGAGKFGTMFLAQARRVAGLHVLGVADLSPERARMALARAGWPEAQYAAASLSDARDHGTTYVGDDAAALIAADGLDVVVEATGVPAAGVSHCLLAIEHGRHIVMVNVEADALVGPLLARRAAEAGVIYSLAYGDQPALIAECVEWARACGFEVVCAGKGTRYLPHYHQSTPDTVWQYYGLSAEQAAVGGMNPQMFNSFLDGTKSAIEMAAVANACHLRPQPHGLGFPPCGVDDLPHVLRPRTAGGQLTHTGTVEVVSSLERDGRPVFRDLRWGVYVVFAAPNDYVRRCFAEYGLVTDASGVYSALYRPYHLIGLELPISVLRVGLRQEPTGYPQAFLGDVVAVAKRDLAEGEMLDGEGGYTVYGKLMPAVDSVAAGALPIGLAHGLRTLRPIAAGTIVRWEDVAYETNHPVVRLRRLMERTMTPEATL